MAVPSEEELQSLKYSDLQRLAKSLGLKANLKADKLLKALKLYFQHEDQQDEGGRPPAPDLSDGHQEEEDAEPGSFVTDRRGGGQGAPEAGAEESVEVEESRPSVENLDGESEPGGSPKQESRAEDLVAVAEAAALARENSNGSAAGRPGVRGEPSSAIPPEGRIPRYVGRGGRCGKTQTKPTTPHFRKLHEAHFLKMESIDTYIERKRKRLEALDGSVKEMKTLTKKANLLRTPQSSAKKRPGGGLLLSPAPVRGRPPAYTPGGPRRSPRTPLGTANKSILGPRLPFKPSVLSATKMNVRFSAATRDNEHKRSLTKTPARKPSADRGGDRRERAAARGKKGRDSGAAVTPFKFTAVTARTPVTGKPTFDLKASLSRPLSYEPHRGRLRPWGEAKENTAQGEGATRIEFHKKTYKQPRLRTREEKRKRQNQDRKGKKASVLGARRGLVVAAD
ncbi:nucleolar and spindle-associated protein 1 isoform X1 [Ornithorhynchus anatinus]|uniref:Nucleolar and spindle associated protein 1 n=1 Tax=Ornithorhynchus anatinus TaxID=9258 RepID=F7FW76_ORNAN|nr:nucleolar and spindle-associated protein 1 isoform X1 [Ornithorhynchus anatinus]